MSYIFCRVSAGRGCSLDYQEAQIRKATDSDGEPIKEVIKYVGSAYKEVAKPLQQLALLKKNKIIFYCVDRFSRNYVQGCKLAADFLANENELYFTVENLSLKAVGTQEWNEFCKLLADAEAESQKISRRVTDAKEYLESQGYFVGNRPPFGYKKIKLENGYSKIEAEEEDSVSVSIGRFIHACRTVGTTLVELNAALSTCGGNTAVNPIIFDEAADVLETQLTFENIATLLNDYEIEGRPWTKTKIAKIWNFDIKKGGLYNNPRVKQKNIYGGPSKHADMFDD